MELSAGQRRAAFVVIVVALAALGAFLLSPSRPGGRPRGSASGPASPAARVAGTPPVATPTPPAGATPGASPPVSIYRLLPFTQAALDQAVGVADRFGAAYGTFSYRQSAAGYVAGMKGLVTASLAAILARGFAAPGVAQLRSQQRQVATGNAVVTSLRAFGPGSLTFVMSLAERLVTASGHSTVSASYAVTVIAGPGGWRVDDIQPASAGNS